MDAMTAVQSLAFATWRHRPQLGPAWPQVSHLESEATRPARRSAGRFASARKARPGRTGTSKGA